MFILIKMKQKTCKSDKNWGKYGFKQERSKNKSMRTKLQLGKSCWKEHHSRFLLNCSSEGKAQKDRNRLASNRAHPERLI